MDTALKSILITAIEPVYIRGIMFSEGIFAGQTTPDVLTWLYQTYGHITPRKLDINKNCIKTPFDPDHPIHVFFKQVTEVQGFASADGN